MLMLASPSVTAQQCPGDIIAPTPGDVSGNSVLASGTYTILNPLELQLNANGIAAIVADSGQYDALTGAGAQMYVPSQFSASGSKVVFTTATDLYEDANGVDVLCGISGYPKITGSQTTFTCLDLGLNTITLTYTDAANNSYQDDIVINVIDPSSPSVVAQAATFYLDNNGALTVSDADAVAFNNNTTSAYQNVTGYCPANFDYSISPDVFDCDDIGANAVTLTVTNPSNNNSGTAATTITVLDTISPEITTINSFPPFVVELDSDGNGVLLFSDLASSDDNCGIQTTTVSPNSFDCDDAGLTFLVTLTATDGSGNTTTSSVSVDVQDNVDPVFTQDLNVVLALDQNGTVDLDTDDSWYTVDEACTFTTTFTPSLLDCDDIDNGASVAYTVTDDSGNEVTGTITVNVEDNINPTVVVNDITVGLNANSEATITTADIDNGSSDNCAIDSYSLDITSFDCDDIGQNSVALTVTDVNGNSSTGVATVTVEDNEAPTTVALDQLYILFTNQLLNGEISVTATVLNPTSTDNCAIVDTVLTDVDSSLFYAPGQLINEFTCADVTYEDENGTLIDKTRKIVIHNLDASGNWSRDTAEVQLVDVDAPTITVTNAIVSLDNDGLVSILEDNYVTATDECGVDSIWLSQTDFDCSDLGTQTISAFARDIHGNENTQTLTITISDVTPPAITLTGTSLDLYLDATGLVAVPATSTLATATDNCTDPQDVTADIAAFDCLDVGLNTVTFTATDAENNSSTASMTVNVIDTISPSITVNNMPSVVLDGSGLGSISINTIDASWSDVCGIDVAALSQTTFDCDDVGTKTVTLTVTDVNNNTTSETLIVTVSDNESPVALTQDVTIALDPTGIATITTSDVDDGSTDNCEIDSYSLSQTDFDCDDLGANIVTLTVEDPSGNTGSETAVITVVDAAAPTLDLIATGDTIKLAPNGERLVTVPGIIGDVTDNCTEVSQIAISVSYTNDCDDVTVTGNSVTLDCDDVSTLPCAQSVTNPNGLRTFIVTATDAEGNTTTEEIDLFVVDLVAPNVYPKNVTLYLPEDANGNASVTVNAGVYTGAEAGDGNDPVGLDSATNDACGIATTGLLQSPTQSTPDASFSYFCTDLGANTYYLRADDVNDNRAATAGVVTIVDTIKPDVTTAIATIFVDANGNATLDPISLVNTAVDNISDCGLTYAASRVDYSCTDDIDFDQTIVNPQSADAQDTDNWGTVDVDLTVTDAAGNERVRAAQVKVVDNIPPVLTRTTITVQLNGLNFVSLQNVQDTIIDFVSEDNCELDPNRGGLSQTYFDCSNVGVNNVTLTMYDVYGNNADVTLLVVVEDLTAPTAVAQDITVQLDANGAASIVPSQIENGSTDNCGIDTYTLDVTSFDCNNVGANTVTLTVTDVHGNSSTATAVVTVEDNVDPSAANLPVVVAIDANGIAVLGGESSSDNCGVASVVYSPASFGCQDLGLQSYTATVTDVNGNSTVYQELVDVIDLISPVAVVEPTLDIYLDVDGEATLTFTDLDLGSFDNCSFVPVLDFTEFDCNNVNLGITVNGTLTDPEGNQTTFSSIVTARDTLGPVFTSSQQDTGLYAVQYDCFAMFGIGADPTFTEDDQNCPGSITWIYQWVDENGNKNTISPGSPIPVGTWTVNTVASDPYDNKTVAPFTVTVLDTTKPTMQFLNSPVIALGSNGQTTVTPAMLENSSYDNCGIESVVITPATVDCDDLGSVTFSVTVTDFNTNTTTYNGITGTVEDNDAPSITVVSGSVDIALDANGDASLVAADVVDDATDNCTANPSLTVSPSSFDCDDLGSVTVTITATDDAGNTSIATKAVNVIDVTAPVITVADITLNLTSNGVVSLPLATASAADNCSSSAVEYSVSNFTCADVGVNVVTVSSTDASNNSSTETFNVTVVDAIAPSITTVGTAPIFVLDNSGAATINVSDVVASYADNCDVLSVSISPDSFDCGDLGTVSVQINVSDVNGNTSAAIQDVVIVDDIDPSITVKSGTVTTYLNAAGVATIVEDDVVATTTDNCTLAPTVLLSATSFSCSEVGSNTITITAIDGSGNSSTATKNVVVVDTISPSITAPSAVTLSLGAGGSVTLPGNTASATDNCGATTLTYSETSFNCSDIGTTNVLVTATDANGNDSEATIAVTVQDVTNPTLALVSSGVTLALDANGSASLATSQIVSSVSDNCSGVTVSVSPSSFGCSDLGSNTVTVTATDASGNTTVETGTVTVVDLIAPAITTVSSAVTTYLNGSGVATISQLDVVATATDNCTLAPTVSLSATSFSCSEVGSNTITITATDGSGNSSTATKNVVVVDTISPSITAPSAVTLSLGAGGSVTLPGNTASATDNCGATTLTYSETSFNCSDIGTTNVLVTATDANGNDSEATIAVTVQDVINPTLALVSSGVTLALDANGSASLTTSQVVSSVSDNCSGVTVSVSPSSFGCSDLGSNTVTVTATDASGNTTTQTGSVTVVDLIDPIIATVASPSDVILDASGNATLTTAMVVASVTDNCTSAPTVTITPTSVDCSDIGIVTVTIIASDNNGNTSTTTVPLNVVDQDAPVIVSAPADTTLPACNSQYNYVVNVTDNCGYTATLTSGLAPGAIFPVGITTVEWVFADASGNSVSHSFDVTVDSLGTYTLPTKDEFCFDNGPFDLQNGQTGLVWTGAGVTAAGDVFQPAQAGIGTHTLGFTFTDANGCEQTGTYTVTVRPTPQQPTVLQITPTTLRSSENGAIYKWYRNGVRIVGQTNQDLFITQGGNYQVEVYNAYGCFRRSTGFVISATGLSVEELLKGVNIYPNPTTSNVSIAFNSALDSELDVEMVDMLGRTLFRGSIPAGDLIFTVDLSSMTAGTYQLIIRDEATGNSTIERIIKVD
jgi:hypothetical protein